MDPIPFTVKQDSTGLGKYNQDFKMIETTVAQRRNLESERMQFETTEQRLQREVRFCRSLVIENSKAYIQYDLGLCSSKSCYKNRNIYCSPTFLLRTMRQAIPECGSV